MLALCVVVPGSVGLGGYGGSAVVYLARPRRMIAVDFDSRAPLYFREGLVTADLHSAHYGARSVTVPAVVAGLDLILREFGTRNWSEVTQPAIEVAEEGFDVDSEHRRYFEKSAPHFDRQSLESLWPGGVLPNIADRWRQPELAKLLRRLADEGPATFYQGDVARQVVQFLHDRGGILSEEDFHSYRPRIDEPVHVRCGGFDFYTPPPPSGGITSLGIVQTVGQFVASGGIDPMSAAYAHVVSEAMKLCWHERSQHLGDLDFVDIPIQWLVSEAAAESRAERIRNGTTLDVAHNANHSPHTSNVVAADPEGNVVSITATQGWMYGSHLVVGGMGLVLNHGMSRFDYAPGHPNSPAPGKRMQHNMAPMIVVKDGRPAFALGMPGGPKIVSVTAQLAINLTYFAATPAASIAAPRLHTEGAEPLIVSSHMPESIIAELKTIGHAVLREEDMGGPVNVLAIDAESGRMDIASGESTGDVAGL